MAKHDRSVLPGTVDLVVLRVLRDGPQHGLGISRILERRSEGVVVLEDAALYQALHRLETQGLLDAEWGRSANNRRAKFYRLTAEGRARLDTEIRSWERYSEAIGHILASDPGRRS